MGRCDRFYRKRHVWPMEDFGEESREFVDFDTA